jgi:23S rRNA (cytidine1920-2'-O)/16S rRNA (cytidine1409-2'-O)-methyltransferase
LRSRKLNARELSPQQFGGGFDLVTGDLSFISLTLVLPALVPLAEAARPVLMLAKPQFELQPGQVGKGGVPLLNGFGGVALGLLVVCWVMG